jgi:hypothetical protein
MTGPGGDPGALTAALDVLKLTPNASSAARTCAVIVSADFDEYNPLVPRDATSAVVGNDVVIPEADTDGTAEALPDCESDVITAERRGLNNDANHDCLIGELKILEWLGPAPPEAPEVLVLVLPNHDAAVAGADDNGGVLIGVLALDIL